MEIAKLWKNNRFEINPGDLIIISGTTHIVSNKNFYLRNLSDFELKLLKRITTKDNPVVIYLKTPYENYPYLMKVLYGNFIGYIVTDDRDIVLS